MLIPFLVTFKNNRVADIAEYKTDAEAEAASASLLSAGTMGIVYYVQSREDLGMEIGDEEPADHSDEMDFHGFDD